MVRRAAKQGAQIILIQELFETPYFCIEQDAAAPATGHDAGGEPGRARIFEAVARELGVVLPISFFERAGQFVLQFSRDPRCRMASCWACIARRTFPMAPATRRRTISRPATRASWCGTRRFARIGVGICWDQWFPETARALALQGAELLLYPTAIGSEPPPAPPVNSRDHWQRTQQGHAAANLMPLIASNRIGVERSLQAPDDLYIRFYGSSFIADAQGAKVAEADEEDEAVLLAQFDLAELAELRDNWFVFRDRRPDLYGALTTLDGREIATLP